MNDVYLAHEKHMSENGKKWPQDAIHPTGFDPLTMGPLTVLEKMREKRNKPLATAQEIEDHLEKNLDEITHSLGACYCVFVGIQAFGILVPTILAVAL